METQGYRGQKNPTCKGAYGDYSREGGYVFLSVRQYEGGG